MSSDRSTGRSVLRVLAASAWRFRRRILAALALLMLAKAATIAVPLALKEIIDGFSERQATYALPVVMLVVYALLRFGGTLFGELRDLVFSRVTQQTVADFTARVFGHLLDLTPRFHMGRETGRLTREVERGTAGIGFLFGVALFTIVPTFVEIAAVMAIIAGNYGYWPTTIIAVTFAVYTTFTVAFTERRMVYQRALNELDSRANSRLVDSLLNYEAVKYYANERYEGGRFGSIMQDWVEAGVSNQRRLSALHIGQSGIIALGVATIMLYASVKVVNGTMTVGDLVLVNAYVIQVCLPLNALGFVFRQAKDALINIERLFELLEEQPEIKDFPASHPLTVHNAEVRFSHVSFGYDPSRRILHDIAFRIAPGKTVAVVGGSGSGKSTIARLLLRFYEANEGGIEVDGQDIRYVTQKSLRDAVGIVPQDTVLFNETIFFNIAYGHPDARREEVLAAARAARVHDFVVALPEQYETVVGERGLKLSGGEKQRIAIARAILKNPPIIIFDEATSALDARAEQAIQAELDRIAENRTTLVIAHRMSTIVGANEILVLEHGRVVERGTHASLLEQGGIYAQMWSVQQKARELQRVQRKLALQPMNLAAVAASVVDGLRAEIDAKHINLYAVVSSDARVVGDPSLIQQAVWDICANAIHGTAAGGRVEIRVEQTDTEARFTVTDTGSPTATGEPGWRGASMARSIDALRARAIAEQHGGHLVAVKVTDVPGSSYTMTLPLRPHMPPLVTPPALALSSAEPDDSARMDDLKVVLIDDDEDRQRLQHVLEARGAHVQTYGRAADALRALESLNYPEWPDVLISDIALPDEDGYSVIRQVRALEEMRHTELAARIPAIALGADEDTTRALLAGFQMQLGKPVKPGELLSAVRHLAS
ncbi:MAG TPA: ATP-binding cassette domain-containing protein [Burkholderiales bacterium]|nr:ATP-binding cassette domain-containing protein [Burkholderiales bacterium]